MTREAIERLGLAHDISRSTRNIKNILEKAGYKSYKDKENLNLEYIKDNIGLIIGGLKSIDDRIDKYYKKSIENEEYS